MKAQFYLKATRIEFTFVIMSKVKEQGGYKSTTSDEGKLMIFDSIRNKYVVNTPEEWVRQNSVKYFREELGFPKSLIAVEKSFKLHRRLKRTDIVLYNNNGVPMILVECKRPSIRITQQTFDQAFRYNLYLKVPYLVITNGEELYCCRVEEDNVTFIKDIPNYQEILNE